MDVCFISDGNISLRPIQEDDAGVFLQWHNDADIRRNIGGLIPFREREFLEAGRMMNMTNPSSIWFIVCVDGNPVGITGLHRIKYIQRNAELSILIGKKEYRNKGIAKSTIKMMEKYAFNSLQIHRLYAYVFADNKPSTWLFIKCGWVKEGILRDAAFWDGEYKDFLLFSRIDRDMQNENKQCEHRS